MSQVDAEPLQADQHGNVIVELGRAQAGKMFYVHVRPAPKRLSAEQWDALFRHVAGTWEGEPPDPDESLSAGSR